MNKFSPVNEFGVVSKEPDLWQALQLFILYRFILAASFWAMLKFNILNKFFIVTNDSLYHVVSLNYFIASAIFLLMPFLIRHHYFVQINLSLFFDVPSIVLLMHACGGMSSAIGLLLMVIVAAHSLLVSERWSLFSAAFAACALIFEQVYNILKYDVPLNGLTQVGLLGTVLLISAYMINTLSIRIRLNQKKLAEHARALFEIQQLNTQIVANMNEGVIVFDNQQNIQHINAAAYQLLKFHPDREINSIKYLPKNFQQAFLAWEAGTRHFYFSDIRLNFQLLGKGSSKKTLVFIYDAAQEVKRAQELKLASLGQLTANIAHELRNPLAAISHAAQLLGESSELNTQDQDFIRIIREHSNRINTIIQNVLSISSRKETHQESINLIAWLKKFAKNLSISNLPSIQFTFDHPNRDYPIKADPSQLIQVLVNLCDNGLRYSFRHTGYATLTFRIRHRLDNSAVILDIIDQGIGVSKPIIKHIFEPFFTTEKQGSGLGLYLTKELCDINHIKLEYIYQSEGGAIFRLTFPLGDDIL